jgi:hypothetical protein
MNRIRISHSHGAWFISDHGDGTTDPIVLAIFATEAEAAAYVASL